MKTIFLAAVVIFYLVLVSTFLQDSWGFGGKKKKSVPAFLATFFKEFFNVLHLALQSYQLLDVLITSALLM